MTCQRTKFIIGRDLVALPTAPALAALASVGERWRALEMPFTPAQLATRSIDWNPAAIE